jgi:hypothetical protein
MDTRKKIAEYTLENYGLRPHFYSDEDRTKLQTVLNATDVYSKLVEESGLVISEPVYTMHPTLDVPPVPREYRVRKADSYGFFRLGMFDAFIRPHLNNVKSCHKFIVNNERAKAPGGNLNYIANPFWATYAIYDDSQKLATVADDNSIEGIDIGGMLGGLRNILATVNVAIGYDRNTHSMVAYFSRVYGVAKDVKVQDNPYIIRLLEYFRYTLGCTVAVSTDWVVTVRDNDLNPLKVSNSNVMLFNTPYAKALITTRLGATLAQVRRYKDIAHQIAYNDKENLYVKEEQTCLRVFTPPNGNVNPSKFRLDMNGVIKLEDHVVNDMVPNSKMYKLLYPKPLPCEECGDYSDKINEVPLQDRNAGICQSCLVSKYVTVQLNEGRQVYAQKRDVGLVLYPQGYTMYELLSVINADLENYVSTTNKELAGVKLPKNVTYVHKTAMIIETQYHADNEYKLVKSKGLGAINQDYAVYANTATYAYMKLFVMGEELTDDEIANPTAYAFNSRYTYAGVGNYSRRKISTPSVGDSILAGVFNGMTIKIPSNRDDVKNVRIVVEPQPSLLFTYTRKGTEHEVRINSPYGGTKLWHTEYIYNEIYKTVRHYLAIANELPENIVINSKYRDNIAWVTADELFAARVSNTNEVEDNRLKVAVDEVGVVPDEDELADLRAVPIRKVGSKLSAKKAQYNAVYLNADLVGRVVEERNN